MNKILLIAACVAVLLILGCTAKAPSANTTPTPAEGTPVPTATIGQHEIPTVPVAAITIEGSAFNPATIKVKTGTIVTWTNNDSIQHSIKADSFQSPNLNKGDSFDHKFESKGTFAYSCGIHASMTGTIIVE